MNKIILAGGGGHALSLLEALADPDEIGGYLALEEAPGMPLPWLGCDNMVPSLAAEGYRFHIAFVYAGLPVMSKRRRLISMYEDMGASFASVIAPTAIVTRNSQIAGGCAVLNGTIVNRAILGNHVVVNSGAIVEHDCVVGSNTFIGPGAVIGGAVTIGEDCFIGLGARVKNCVTIASGVTVGMGAIVDRDLTEPGIYRGNPLRFHSLERHRL